MARLYATVKVGDQTKFVPLESVISTDGDVAILKAILMAYDGSVYRPVKCANQGQ